MWNMVMSLPEYRNSLAGLTELELWYAAKQGATCRHDFKTAVNLWTDLYSFSSCFDRETAAEKNAAWSVFLDNLSRYDVAAFMRDFEPRLERDLEKAGRDIALSSAGFMYEFHHEYFRPPDSGDLLTLHFRNYFAPDSPANHVGELAAKLRGLVAKARAERPEVKKVQCASWLNDIPFFLALFPDEWRESAADCPYEPSTGWWGQFIDRTGGINQKNAAYLKEHGAFKHQNVHCVCSVDGLERRLASIIPNAKRTDGDGFGRLT